MTGKKLHIGLLFVAMTALVAWLGACTPTETAGALEQSGECGADDPRVGWVAELTDRFIHGVSGTARIVDNCTIVIENFNFDGLGVPPAVVGIVNEDFGNPIILNGNILKPDGYHNATLVVPLPAGVTLDDVPMISITCLGGVAAFDYGNLGEGYFHAPGTPQPVTQFYVGK